MCPPVCVLRNVECVLWNLHSSYLPHLRAGMDTAGSVLASGPSTPLRGSPRATRIYGSPTSPRGGGGSFSYRDQFAIETLQLAYSLLSSTAALPLSTEEPNGSGDECGRLVTISTSIASFCSACVMCCATKTADVTVTNTSNTSHSSGLSPSGVNSAGSVSAVPHGMTLSVLKLWEYSLLTWTQADHIVHLHQHQHATSAATRVVPSSALPV